VSANVPDGYEPSLPRTGSESRERTREQVRAAFAATDETPLRRCPHCGAQRRTRYEHCPVCSNSYFVAPPRLSRRTRLVLALLLSEIAIAAVAVAVLGLAREATESRSKERARHAAAVAAERHRLSREQAPQHARVADLLPGPDASPSVRRDARRQMRARLEALITADARGRIARGQLRGSTVRATECGPRNPGRRTRVEDSLDQPLGRYSCNAVTQTTRAGSVTSSLGIPFVAVIDFGRGKLTWCKDNPVSPSDIDSQLAFVRLARECTAAHGPAVGSGYVSDLPDRPARRTRAR
jgi:hypothetical protein